jgi:hypothetical protein
MAKVSKIGIPVHIAEKILKLSQGDSIPSSSARHAVIEEFIAEKIIERTGRIQKKLSVSNPNALLLYLQNQYSINDLEQYISTLHKENISRSDVTKISGNSKLKNIRTFRGFLINSYNPIPAKISGKPMRLNSIEGSFLFIYDFEGFSIPQDITIVGIENPENFRNIEKQTYLFEGIKPLFVSRYPQNQSKDLIKWLQSIPNNYLHYGDFDFAGIGIYLNEYKKYLADRATFFVPENIEQMIIDYGNRELYNNQKETFNNKKINEKSLIELIKFIHKYKKGLEQEIFIAI